jgi:hypothetical protein
MNKSISEITESDFLYFVTKICNAEFPTEKEHDRAILEFQEMVEHPGGSDLIYYSEEGKDSPEAIVQEVKDWRAANGKPGFKPA